MSDNKPLVEISNEEDPAACLPVSLRDADCAPFGTPENPINITGDITIDPTGLATDDNQTNGDQKTQIVDGSGNVIGSTGNAMDVNIKTPATLPVSVASLPLPSGAATEAKQDAEATLIGAVNETAPGTDTASSGLNGRLQRIAQRLTSLITALGSPFQAGGSIGNTSFGSTVADGANVVEGAQADAIVAAGAAGTLSAKLRRVTQGLEDLKTLIVLAAGSAIIGKVGIDQTTPGTTDRVTNNQDKIGGNSISVNSGNKDNGTQRFVLATDQPNLTTPLNVEPQTTVPGSATTIRSSAAITGSYVASSAFNGYGRQRAAIDFLFSGTPTNAGCLEAYLVGSDDSFSTELNIRNLTLATSLVADNVTTFSTQTIVRVAEAELTPIEIPFPAAALSNNERVVIQLGFAKEYKIYVRAAGASGITTAGAGGTYPTLVTKVTLL